MYYSVLIKIYNQRHLRKSRCLFSCSFLGGEILANRIKGITVEIGGDTIKLQTALKQVNTEIKHTQSELRDVNKLLKLDPGNTELIS